MLHETYRSEISSLLARYDDQRSAVLPLLYIAQDHYGVLRREVIQEVADILHMPYTAVFEVVGFYTLFYEQTHGTWMLQVCDDVPCCYLGAEELLTALKDTLGVREEETSSDGMFTIQRVKCLAACDRAPMLQANLSYYYDVTPDKADALLRHLRALAEGDEAKSASGHHAQDYEPDQDGSFRLIPLDLGATPTAPAHPLPGTTSEPTTPPPAEPDDTARTEQPTEPASPVEPSPDGSPAGAHPSPDAADAEGTVPAQSPQQQQPTETKPRKTRRGRKKQ